MQALALKILWPLLGAVAACAVVIGLWEHAPIVGPKARVAAQAERAEKFKTAYLDWRSYGKAEAAAFKESERLRGLEQTAAKAALAEAAKTCAARITAARKSAAAIRVITTQEPTRDQNGCPVRAVVPPGQLRDALNARTGR